MIKFVVPILTIDKEQTIDFYCKLGFVVVSKDLLLREPSIYLHLYESTLESVALRKKGDELDLLFSILSLANASLLASKVFILLIRGQIVHRGIFYTH